jgi:hypothetical protein
VESRSEGSKIRLASATIPEASHQEMVTIIKTDLGLGLRSISLTMGTFGGSFRRLLQASKKHFKGLLKALFLKLPKELPIWSKSFKITVSDMDGNPKLTT